jgi:ATP-dependent helicase HepA
VRVIVSHKLVEVTEALRGTEARLQKGSPYKLLENADIVRRVLPAMIEAATKLAEAKAAALRETALTEMNQLLGREVQRLQMLQQVNDHIRPQEIQLAQAQQKELTDALQTSRLRLDALRLIWKGPPETLR